MSVVWYSQENASFGTYICFRPQLKIRTLLLRSFEGKEESLKNTDGLAICVKTQRVRQLPTFSREVGNRFSIRQVRRA